MTRRHVVSLFVTVLLVGLAAVGPVNLEAHHAYGAYYRDQHVSIEGTIERFVFRNPHALIEVHSANGKVYDVEWAAAYQLKSAGVTSDTLKPGDRIIVTGSPARDPLDHRISLLTEVRRPSDGWRWANIR